MAEPSTVTEMVRVPILGENGRISDDYIPESIPQAVTAAEQAATSAASSANQALQQAAAAEKAASSATGSVEQAKNYANNASKYMTTAESHADSAATDAQDASTSASAAAASAAAAEESNKSAAQSSADAMGFRNSAVQYRDQAREAAQEAQGYVSTVQQLEQNATNSATAAQNSATSASASAESATTAASQASTSATNAAASAQTASEKAASVLDHYIESATATTLEPGQQATATVADKVLQLGIPKGDKGDPGEVSAVQAAEGSDLSVSTDEGTVTIDDSALRARIDELEQQAQNAVTGTSTDLVSHGEDAYAQKPIEVRVKGKTRVNRWPVIEGSRNGVTVSTGVDGLITLSGTASAAAVVSANVQGVSPNKQITVVPSKKIGTGASTAGLWVRFYDSDGAIIVSANTIGFQNSNPVTLTTPSNMASMTADVAVYEGQTVNTSFRVMLVDGTEAPDCFTPPASITSVQTGKLVTSGKNLAIINEATVASETGASNYVAISEELPPGTYIVRGSESTNTIKACARSMDNSATVVYTAYINSGAAITIKFPMVIYIYHDPNGGVAYSVDVTNIQLELGSTATSYEPPSITTTPLPEVELRSLPNGTCDELVIKEDGTCEVERRTVEVTFDGSEDENWIQYMSNTLAFTAHCYNVFADSPINAGKNQESASTAVVCRELPVIRSGFSQNTPSVSASYMATDRLYVTAPSTVTDIDSFKQWLAANPITCVVNVNGKPDEPQSPVPPPTLPAPTFNQYHDADVPSDTSTEYVRDINIVLANLEAVQAALLGGE